MIVSRLEQFIIDFIACLLRQGEESKGVANSCITQYGKY